MSKFFTMMVLALLVLGSVQAREEARVKKSGPADTEELIQRLDRGEFVETSPSGNRVAVELGRTFYDYATNNVTARQLAWAIDTQDGQDGIHFAFMKIFPDNAAERYVTYDYYDLNLDLFFGNSSVTEDARTGWGRVVNGTDDKPLISMHGGGTRLWADDAEISFLFTNLLGDGGSGVTFPGVARIGDRILFVTNGTTGAYVTSDSLLLSDDNGATWTALSPGFPIDAATVGTNSEMWPTFDPTNPNRFAVVHAPDITANAPNGETVVAYGEIDGSTITWSETQVLDDDALFTTSSGQTQYIAENFGQVNGMFGTDGTYHVVIGAVQGVLDTSSALIDNFPILYWNDSNGALVEITNDAADSPADTNTINNLAGLRPGNGLGNSYPSISEGPNGELFAVWNQWEDNGAGGLVTTIPAGGTEVFLTDVWGAFSSDGGATWSDAVYVAGQSEVAESFPILNKNFVYDATSGEVTIDMVYMEDTNPGVSLFAGGNDASECIWYYERVTLSGFTSIDGDNGVVVTDFKLEQNYPNPFNPTTTINYELKKAAEVTLDIYNVLGEKVSTLVNERRNAGSYTAEFNAASFSSGVYFYTLTSGNVSITKKMVLMK